MPDIFTPEKRSYVMSRIRSKDTSIELKMAVNLKENGIRFSRHVDMVGTPDFLVGDRTLVFCDGDFWHGYDYRHGKVPPQKFWRDKIERNMKRDKRTNRLLRSKGYSVLRIWEHDINRNTEKCIRKIMRSCLKQNPYHKRRDGPTLI